METPTDVPDNCCQHVMYVEGMIGVICQWLAGVEAHRALILRLVDNVEADTKAVRHHQGLHMDNCKVVHC